MRIDLRIWHLVADAFGMFLLLTGAQSLASFFAQVSFSKNQTLEEARAFTLAVGRVIEKDINLGAWDSVQRRLRRLETLGTLSVLYHFRVADESGRVFADSRMIKPGGHLAMASIANDFHKKPIERFSFSKYQDFSLVVTFENATETNRYFLVNTVDWSNRFDNLWMEAIAEIVFAAIAIAIIASLVFVFVWNYAIAPLSGLHRVVESVIAGREEKRASLSGTREIRLFSKTFNEMLERIVTANEELRLEITERKRAEEQVKASLAEKEVLLREIHHRVKNNLQVISSMLSLQASTETDDRSLKALEDSQRRVKVMARIHENLHQSSGLTSINGRDYLSTVVEDTIASSGHDAQRISSRLDVDEDDIIFDVDQAVACGQIVSELLSNSLKHAFPNGRSGNIVISLHRRDGGRIELTVADDGEGLPENFDLEQPETLGIRLVHALVMQLNGAANVDGSVGTRVQITFPKNRS